MGSFEGNPDIANGVGKSSIMEAIRFALYGKCKYSTKSKVVKRGKSSCKVEFVFSVDGDEYKIVRSLSAKTGIITLDFTKKVGDEYKPEGYTCDTPSATNRKIIETVGMNDDTFVNIVYFRQNDLSGFAYARVSKRKEILKEALQIGIWDEFQKVSKDAEKKLEEKKKALDIRLEPLKNIEEEVAANVEKLKKSEEHVTDIKGKIEQLEKRLVNYSKPAGNRKQLVAELHKIKERSEELLQQRNIIRDRVKVNNRNIGNAHNDCASLEKRLVNYYLEALAIPHKDSNKIKSLYKQKTGKEAPRWSCDIVSLDEKIRERDEHNTKISQHKVDLKRLISLKPGKECPVCLTEIENPEGVEKRREAKRKFLENCIEEKVVKTRELEREIGREKEIVEKAKNAFIEIERTELIISKHMANISELTRDNETAQRDFSIIAKEWKSLDERAKIIRLHLENTEDDPNTELVDLREELIRLSVEQGNIKGYREGLERRRSEKETIEQELEVVSANMAVYSKLTKAFGKDGIQAIILENITEDLRQFANSVLRNIYYRPISIDFVTQKQTGTGSWKEDFDIIIDMDGEKYDFEDVSGGEQVRISIAIRLALSQLLMRRVGSNVKFLLFDEVDQALDRHGLEALADTISRLSNEFKILVITHNEYMKEKFEHVITVHMGPSGSVLK
jgi:exonuclease SbcC